MKKIKNIVYIFGLILAAVCFYNVCIGIGDETVFLGIKIARNETMAVYAVIVLALTLFGIIFTRIMDKHGKHGFITYVSAYFFMAFLFEFIIIGKLNSMICFVTVLACHIAAAVFFLTEQKGIISPSAEFEWKDWKQLVPYFAFWVVLTGISIPVELYINNLGDFQFMFWHYLAGMILCSVVTLACIYLLSVFLLSQRQAAVITTLIFSFAAMGYIQQMLMNRGLGLLNGDQQVWGIHTLVINTLIWLAGMAAVGFFRIKYKKAEKLYFIISVYIILIQIVSSAFLIMTGDTNNEAAFKTFTREGSLELNEKDNIIVFVLDRCDASYIYKIAEETPDFFNPLKDFTFYPDNTCEFAKTQRAIAYMLTGTEFEKGQEYPRYAYENSDFLQVLHDSGYNIAIYTDEDHVEEPYRENVLNYDSDVKQKCRVIDTFFQLMTCSKYKLAPIIMKNMYIYNGRDIDNLIDESYTWTITDDYPFYCSLVEDRLTISDKYKGKGTFYFYHFCGSHEGDWSSVDMKPVKHGSVSKEEQTKAAFKMLYEYMDQMKQLDKYNDATIIITADHGVQLSLEYYLENGIVNRTTIPALFVKYSNDVHDEIKVNEAPVSQGDLIPTILSVIGADYAGYGRTFEEIGIGEERKRIYVTNDGPIFEIKGDARQKENWQIVDYAMEE